MFFLPFDGLGQAAPLGLANVETPGHD